MNIGYARVSTRDQSANIQQERSASLDHRITDAAVTLLCEKLTTP